MNQDRITELAEEAGIDVDGPFIRGSTEELQRFAELVRSDTLEEAVRASETQWITSSEKMYGVEFATYLRSMK